jgi:zinicin-like metallopeptidase
MDFEDFERFARGVFGEIPEVYRDGVDGLTVRREASKHPDLPGVYTLGECLTEEHPSDFGSAETTRSVIALYWGSFQELSLQNPGFDWEEEAWETLTHELRHHLESLAGDDALEAVDYAADESFKRVDAQDFDPWYFQSGEEVRAGVFEVEGAWFVQQEWTAEAFASAAAIAFEWDGRHYLLPKPDELGDVHFIQVLGLDGRDLAPESIVLEVVLLRKRSWWQSFKRVFGGSGTVVIESEAHAEPVGREG